MREKKLTFEEAINSPESCWRSVHACISCAVICFEQLEQTEFPEHVDMVS